MLLNKENITKLFNKANNEYVNSFIAQYQDLFIEYEIDSPTKIKYFLAQLGYETNGYTKFEENLNYSAKKIYQLWPKIFKSINGAKRYENSPDKIANFIYANRFGNGNLESNDGWMYHGRGGLYNYTIGREIYQKITEITNINFIEHPEYLIQPDYCLLAACAIWKIKYLNEIHDNELFTVVTTKLTGTQDCNLQDRKNWLKRVEMYVSITI
jgi:putative chitinase